MENIVANICDERNERADYCADNDDNSSESGGSNNDITDNSCSDDSDVDAESSDDDAEQSEDDIEGSFSLLRQKS